MKQNISTRKSIRLKDYDYQQSGAYFVTLVSWRRQCIFGEFVGGEIVLSPIGKIIDFESQRLIHQFHNVQWEKFVIMPNHIHGLIVIKESRTWSLQLTVEEKVRSDDNISHSLSAANAGSHLDMRHLNGPASGSLGAVIGQLKSRSTKRIWKLPEMDKCPIWQRGYYDHIIRDGKSLENIYLYIEANPENWSTDEYY